jgi:type II secretory pathway pseudopilin PulG
MASCGEEYLSGQSVRRGLTLLEITIAAVLLGLVMTTSVQVLRALQTQQRAADRRAAALQAVQSLAEQVSNLTSEDITTERLKQLEITGQMATYLPEAKLVTSLAEERDPIPAKRVAFELTWRGPNGQHTAPVRLTVWVYSDESR